MNIHFGTDGWRAIIGEDFTDENLIRVVDAASRAFKETLKDSGKDFTSSTTLIIGHDCRQNAHRYAQLASEVAASHGFSVKLSKDYCPTPALCWSVERDEDAVGGIMLTSSHNPAEYLGVKLRMEDGGASPKAFTDKVEELLQEEMSDTRGAYVEVDLMAPYLASLKTLVNVDAIGQAGLRIVVDPLYGAGRKYLAHLLEELGVEVVEINNATDPSFDGLHPEPIPPWIDRGRAKVKELGFTAGFVTDGDADRIGAVDDEGNFVNPHRILTLLVAHLVEDRGENGRVVSTITSSALLARQCKRLGLDYTTTPVGFKWIYGEMEKGDVMIGGEESGGIGIPTHVKERDGLLMALLLTEMMAQRKQNIRELVDEMFGQLGKMEFARKGLTLSDAQMKDFNEKTVLNYSPKAVCGKEVIDIDRRDGIKLYLDGDAWLMMRPSGTEPLVRIYAEASSTDEVEELLNFAEKLIYSK